MKRVVIVVSTIFMAGCGAAAIAPSPTVVPTIAPTPQTSYSVGKTAVLADGQKITVLQFKSPLKNPGDIQDFTPNASYAGAEIEWCAGADPAETTNDFSLVWPDNTRTQANLIPMKPELVQTTLQPGRCNRGWLVFPIPNPQARPVAIEHQGYEWRVR